ncbi:hypothetical protein ACGTN6_20570, partial [Halomonas sp. THAF12]|uniref:hypothetical protein n=1 Tax=Halomonas sp. B23F22_10 TaxID=3459515 RepID=UPI00373FAE61
MPQHVSFELTLTLGSPVIVPFRTTLDGLLSFAAEAMTGERGEKLTPHIPLAMDPDSGIFRASAIFLGSGVPGRADGKAIDPDIHFQQRVMVRSLKTDDDLDAAKIAPRVSKTGKPLKKPYPDIDKKRGDYANKLTNYTTALAPKAVCYGVGDPDAVMLLLELVMGLGKHAAQGMGEITQRKIRVIERDRSWVLPNQEPARSLPVAVW